MAQTNPSPKVDRRIQRTRNSLRDALMRLIEEKGYDEITIQDITDRANIARTTFYLHFKNVDDLLFQTMRDMYEDLYAQSSYATATQDLLPQSEADCDATDFEHVGEFAEFYKVMLGERGSAAFLTRVRHYLAESVMEQSLKQITDEAAANLPVEFVAHVLAGAHIAAIKWWLDTDMALPPQKMAYMLHQLFSHGLGWSLGIADLPTAPTGAADDEALVVREPRGDNAHDGADGFEGENT